MRARSRPDAAAVDQKSFELDDQHREFEYNEKYDLVATEENLRRQALAVDSNDKDLKESYSYLNVKKSEQSDTPGKSDVRPL